MLNNFKDNSTEIEVPDFDGINSLKVRVKRPQLMAMMSQGKIPNHLMDVAVKATLSKPPKNVSTDEEQAKELARWIEFYCTICMVEPTYDEIKEVITDDQALSIYAWAIAPIKVLRSFRNDSEDETNNRNGEVL